MEESTVVSGRLDVVCELPNHKHGPRQQTETPEVGIFPKRKKETTRWAFGLFFLPQFL